MNKFKKTNTKIVLVFLLFILLIVSCQSIVAGRLQYEGLIPHSQYNDLREQYTIVEQL
ncbi:MAG: hypothetical protein FWF58_02055 [Firmicutes bacterium]|nr:hypothetical protein [Bacillota bacterium]